MIDKLFAVDILSWYWYHHTPGAITGTEIRFFREKRKVMHTLDVSRISPDSLRRLQRALENRKGVRQYCYFSDTHSSMNYYM